MGLCNFKILFTLWVFALRARRWLLTVSGMCHSHNASLIRTLRVWQRSVDQMFAGVEEW